jgi:hypothetical protein
MARQFQEQLEEEVDVDRNRPSSWHSPESPTPEHAEPATPPSAPPAAEAVKPTDAPADAAHAPSSHEQGT